MLNKTGILFFIFICLILFAAVIFFLKQSAKYNAVHVIVFVGDSMTEYLGNFDELRGYLKKYFPGNK